MPYFLIDGESVYDRLREPKFHLLAFDDGRGTVQTPEVKAEDRHADLFDFQTVRLGPQAAEAFGADGPFAVLLRPDNYIGYISAEPSSGELDTYLKKYLGYSG